MPNTVHYTSAQAPDTKLSDDELRIYAVKDSLGILSEPASEDLVRKLCLEISRLREAVKNTETTSARILSEDEAEDLDGRLYMNSSNSSIPPRANGYRRPKKTDTETNSTERDDSDQEEDPASAVEPSQDEYEEENLYTKNRSLRVSSGRKPGKQEGAKGNGLKKPKNAVLQETVYHVPEKCENCPLRSKCMETGKATCTHHVYDAKITITDTPHVTMEFSCPKTGEKYSGEFSEEASSTQQYGNNIKTMALVLSVFGMISVNRIHDILSAFFDLPISTGTIQNWIEKADEKVKPILARIMEELFRSIRVHCDETGVHIKGKLKWIHTVCNEKFTYLSIQAGRGYDSICNIGFLTKYQGIVIHDCLAAYWKFKNVTHGLCCAHLQRELKWVIEFKKKNKVWAQALFDLLVEMNNAVDAACLNGSDLLEDEVLKDFSDRYDRLVEEAINLNPEPQHKQGKRGRKKKGKVLSLVLRLKEHKDEVFLFATNFNATYSNNLAESSFRMVSGKRNVVGSFRSEKGAESFVDLYSYISTCRKHGINCYIAMKELLYSNAEKLLFEDNSANLQA